NPWYSMIWYPWLWIAYLPWIHVTFRLRNAIEGSFRTLKEGLRGFRNRPERHRESWLWKPCLYPGIRIQPPKDP
ncbi:hypothetical protein KEJ36_04290, partial [Candidatus Bathyarchaeota archaeon]|nr:hypothetical protein [Candidatus Bathyarchaeota archaeon]